MHADSHNELLMRLPFTKAQFFINSGMTIFTVSWVVSVFFPTDIFFYSFAYFLFVVRLYFWQSLLLIKKYITVAKLDL